jgi:hypothetical protein
MKPALQPFRLQWATRSSYLLSRHLIPQVHPLLKSHRGFLAITSQQAPNKSSLKSLRLPPSVEQSRIEAARYFPSFNLQDHVIVVTGGGRGLGLALAGAVYQGGAKVHCLDRLSTPHEDFHAVQRETDSALGGTLNYHQVDVTDTKALQGLISDIASQNERMDGLIAAAGVQRQCPALEYPVEQIREMMEVNYVAVYTSAQEVARQMIKWRTPGPMCLIASMSATVGFLFS